MALTDMPKDHRIAVAGRLEHQASQLNLLASVLRATTPAMTVGNAYDALCRANNELDH